MYCPPTKWGYWLASHENPGTGENTERSGKVIVVVVVVVVVELITSKELLLLDPLVHDPLAALRPQPHFHLFREEVPHKTVYTGSGFLLSRVFLCKKQ